ELSADLAELRGPEGEGGRDAAVVRDGAVGEAVGGVEADAGEPSVPELVVGRGVEAVQAFAGVAAAIGDRLQPADEGAVQPLLQRLPAIRHVHAAELVVRVVERAPRV